ncbi:hypothetical protein MLD38_020343 [Melastoma candidum]|uniref:Uncharacterized protein n=1 Tax=Melastoma candidum TaxID=119954 RepID=A0ACB9QD44_9MYRT|nr:hypothetical protein MLD38_020343 [Melastoma candidum]
MSNGGVMASHWPWYKKLEEIVGNVLLVKSATNEQTDSIAGTCEASAVPVRQSKRTTAAPCTTSPLTIVKSRIEPNPKWRRVVFKVSGAALAGPDQGNIDPKIAISLARDVALTCRLGVQVAIVVGALEKMGIETRVQSTLPMHEVIEPYNRQKAIRHLEKGQVVIFGGIGAGTGNPLFSTDTAVALRASEIHAEALLKGTNVDDVYDCNSQDNNLAFDYITFREWVSRGATSMDMMALTFCEENVIPVVVFNLLEAGNIS